MKVKRLNIIQEIKEAAHACRGRSVRAVRLGAVAICVVMLSCPSVAAEQSKIAQPGLAPTPPMGWANWNYYFCDYNEQTIRDQADALVQPACATWDTAT
jgi:hypothetical protein